VIGVYIFYNLIYALFAFPTGILADRVGLKTIFIIGLVLFSVVYFGMALNNNLYLFFGLFFLYWHLCIGDRGDFKAWITNITDKKDTATAIGTYTGLQSICTMLASSLTGLIWFRFGGSGGIYNDCSRNINSGALFYLYSQTSVLISNDL
jgi:MFS family permease